MWNFHTKCENIGLIVCLWTDAGGSGWWDSDMEGIDNEAVGSSEVWEGVGSATMGGLDWH